MLWLSEAVLGTSRGTNPVKTDWGVAIAQRLTKNGSYHQTLASETGSVRLCFVLILPPMNINASCMRIMVAEDDLDLADQVRKTFLKEGHAIDLASDGEEVRFLGESEPYDLILLDLGLPRLDGISILKAWRNANINIPILILTARDGWADRVDGLDAGADDYLTKPFHVPELMARARALLRRNATQRNPVYQKDGVRFDSRNGKVSLDDFQVSLTAQETAVLSYLFHNANRPISRTELSEHIYEYDDDRDSNTVAVFVTRLRKKLGNDLIQTERGRGYSIQLDA